MAKKENKSEIKKIIDELNANPQHKAWVFLAIYFIFFALIILALRSNNSGYVTREEENNNIEFSMSNIENNNYHFKYSVNLDGNETVYEGDKYNKKELFTKTRLGVVETYYQEDNTFLVKINDNYISVNNPYEIITFRDYDTLKNILNSSTYISKTENVDKSFIYNYQISTTTLYKIFDLDDIDIEDLPNEIKATTDSNNNLIKLEFDFSQYYKYKSICTNSLVINMEFSKFDEISDIHKN